MPQGKGTYGSKVGRPPKKDKYQDGGSIDPFSLKNPEGNIAEKMMEAKEGLNSIPTANAMERSQVSPMGNEVGTGVYKEGGVVGPYTHWAGDVDRERYEAYKKKMKAKGKSGIGFEEYTHARDEYKFANLPRELSERLEREKSKIDFKKLEKKKKKKK